MQEELKQRNEREIKNLLDETIVNDSLHISNDEINQGDAKKENRQQRRKDKKAALMKQMYQEAKEEASLVVNWKDIEDQEILEKLRGLNLKIKEVWFEEY